MNLPAVGTLKAYCCYIVMKCRRERILKRCAFSMRSKAPQPTGRSVTVEVAMGLRWLSEGQAATFQVLTFVIFWWMLRVSVCVIPSLIGKIAITRSKSPARGQFAIPLDLASPHLASKAFKPTGIFLLALRRRRGTPGLEMAICLAKRGRPAQRLMTVLSG